MCNRGTRADADEITFEVVTDFAGSLPTHVYGPLVRDLDGNIYGAGSVGGNFNKGAIFKVDRYGILAPLHHFSGPDGAYPFGGLTRGPDGALFGTTSEGGTNNQGTVFRITAEGGFRLLHSFESPDATTGIAPEGLAEVGRIRS